MAQQLTPVEFFFVAPNGDPVSNTIVSIQLAKGGFDEDVPGVIMPREIIATTDLNGRVVVSLQPSETVYYVTVEDSVSEAALSYKFYVPVTAEGDVVRLQDIIVDTVMSPKPYDEAALLLIHEVKASVLTHRVAAELAENNSEAAQVAAEAARDMALRTMPTTSATPPLNPIDNQEWINSSSGRRYTWYVVNGQGVWAEIFASLVIAQGFSTPTTDPTQPTNDFNPSTLPKISSIGLASTSLLVEDQGTGYRASLAENAITSAQLPIATSLNRTDFTTVTINGVDKQVSIGVLADAIYHMNQEN